MPRSTPGASRSTNFGRCYGTPGNAWSARRRNDGRVAASTARILRFLILIWTGGEWPDYPDQTEETGRKRG